MSLHFHTAHIEFVYALSRAWVGPTHFPIQDRYLIPAPPPLPRQVRWLRSLITQHHTLTGPIICQSSPPLWWRLDGDKFLGCGTASLAAATESLHLRYYSLVGNFSSKPPGGSEGGVLLRPRVWRGRHQRKDLAIGIAWLEHYPCNRRTRHTHTPCMEAFFRILVCTKSAVLNTHISELDTKLYPSKPKWPPTYIQTSNLPGYYKTRTNTTIHITNSHNFGNVLSTMRVIIVYLVRTPPPPVRRHHQIAASGRDP